MILFAGKKSMTATSKILVGFFVYALALMPLQSVLASQAASVSGNYEIKLQDKKYLSRLANVADNLHERFVNSSSPEFFNIYTFSSNYSLSFLQDYLQGDFLFLEPETQINEALAAIDPGFTSNPQDVDKEWALPKAGFDTAWNQTTGSKNNLVAIIDTGVDETHQDLRTINFVPGFDFVANQPLPLGVNSDDNGHGTLVAGVLGATANNGIGVAGTNWQISVMPIKALDSTGKGDAVTLAEAIVWATDHGAQFLNLSVGGVGFGHDTSLANAISYAFNKNVVIVAAAGNDVATVGGSLDQSPVFPICDDNNFNMVIGVAAVDQNDLKPDFSNYGRNCIDVTAPGKRILSTINFDPLTKKPAPNSYAYASGTSLAVPYVVGQAALIRALYPQATNVQIRDRIISTADPIDDLNLSQCSGGSCRGLLGSGRINVPKSLQNVIFSNFSEGDLLKVSDTGEIYQILGGQKRLVSPFVYNQRFAGASLKTVISSQLNGIQSGPYVTPIDGTLVKLDSAPTIYLIQTGQKLPVTYGVFKQRNFNFSNVSTLSFSELNSWTTGNFLPPLDGSILRTAQNKTVYWTVGQVLHPVNWNFYLDRGLNVFPIMIVSDADIAGYPVGEAYIR